MDEKITTLRKLLNEGKSKISEALEIADKEDTSCDPVWQDIRNTISNLEDNMFEEYCRLGVYFLELKERGE